MFAMIFVCGSGGYRGFVRQKEGSYRILVGRCVKGYTRGLCRS